jgi:metal transporter CNNM
MTPIDKTFVLNVEERLNFKCIATIFKTGYSRIPVYEVSHNSIIGLLFAKDLIFVDPEDETPLPYLFPSLGEVLTLCGRMKSLEMSCENSSRVDPTWQ